MLKNYLKKATLLLSLLVFTTTIWAAPVDVNVAKKAAESYAKQLLSKRDIEVTLYRKVNKMVATGKMQNGRKRVALKNYYYAFNIGNNEGFVIVSADTKAREILGYTDKGTFDYETLPANAKAWLKGYEEEIAYAIAHDVEDAEHSTKPMAKVSQQTTAVAPLLGTIAFNQSTPYNDDCPVITTGPSAGKRTVTGCVATAMAQVMKYHEYPAVGQGSNTYTSNTHRFNLTLDFSAEAFDWSNILPFYTSGSYNTTQAGAVAHLLYSCGVAVDMNYDLSSGASSKKAAQVLVNNFKYDNGIDHYSRKYYLLEEWTALIKAELDATRPVIISGRNNEGGHSFVCDGYDSNGLFHINWGWGGLSNGYFQLSALNPSSQGIGSSNGGYNQNQDIIAGIQPLVATSKKNQILGITNGLTVPTGTINRDDNFSITFNQLANIGLWEYTKQECALALYQGNTRVTIVNNFNVHNPLPSGSFYFTMTKNISIPTSVANGTYILKPIFKNENDEWEMMKIGVNKVGELPLTITDTQITFNTVVYTTELSLTAIPTVEATVYQNNSTTATINVENTGNTEFNAQIGLQLVSKTTSTTYNVANALVQINIGASRDIVFNFDATMDLGDYDVKVLYDANNETTTTTFPITQMSTAPEMIPIISIVANTLGDPVLTVSNEVMPSIVYQHTDFNFTMNIKNTGGQYNDKLIAFVFPSGGGSSLTSLGYQQAVINNNETKKIIFTGNLNLSVGNYIINAYSKNSNGNWTKLSTTHNFEVKAQTDTSLSDENADVVTILENPVKNRLKIKVADSTTAISIHSITGKCLYRQSINSEKRVEIPVADYKQGIYLLNVTSGKTRTTLKFIKD